MEIKGKACIVTGGGSGIGKSACELLVAQGAKVSICDLDVKVGEELVQSLNKKHGSEVAIFNKCDVTDIKVFRECFKKTVEKFGCVDVLFNNAGIWDDSPTGWSKQIDVNFKGVVNGCSLAFEFMGAMNGGPGGTVVNTASLLGLSTNCLMPVYSGTKAAVIALSRCFSTPIYYNLSKIRFTVICPNATGTHLFEGVEKHFFMPSTEILDLFTNLNDTTPFQTPESVAKCMLDACKNGENGSVWVVEFDKPGIQVKIIDLPLDGVDKNRTVARQVL